MTDQPGIPRGPIDWARQQQAEREAAAEATGPAVEPLRPRAERCPESDCTDEQQCWRCDYEESQHAARTAIAEGRCPACGQGDAGPEYVSPIKASALEQMLTRAEQAETALAEARTWARHGYEIGQRHCGWSDHGVAPQWLTEGWPHAIDSCEHLRLLGTAEDKLARVRDVIDDMERITGARSWAGWLTAALDGKETPDA